jgi:LuxR family transcriptional regulator, maltose regulon positive regulatory protein
MSKTAPYLLIWSAQQDAYMLYGQHNNTHALLRGDEPVWFRWLASHTSFSFQGQHGRLNLHKETRPRGREGYWYAYRRQGKRIIKKYVGRSAQLTTAHLETTAQDLASPSSALPSRQGEQEAASSDVPLLLTKFQPPCLPASLVKRERLFTLLDGVYSHPLTLLVAPAGFGKTTLAGQWISSRGPHEQTPPVSWISLEKGDNDPMRFWRYVITACQSFHARAGDAVLAQLSGGFHLSFEQHFLERVLTPFLNAMTLYACRGLLVLEDYHVITEPSIHETLAFFIDHLPASLHIIVLSRTEPPLPLARWRANGALQEIQASDLRFTPAETATFLQQTLAFSLSEETIQRLDAQLEGWAVGLRLLTLTLQGHATQPNVEQLLSLLTSNHRSILDYFIREVIAAQEEQVQHFLLQTSVLSRLSDSLCDAITGRRDSSLLLEKVERAGLFLQSLNEPGQWYRYHELFAEALRHEARHRLGEKALHTLSLRACRWYEAHDMLDESIETALAIHEYAYAASLLERYAGPQLFGRGHHTLHRWLSQLPEEILRAHPTLCFLYAMAHLFVKDRYAPETRAFLEEQLQKAEQSWHAPEDRPKLGAVFTVRSLAALWQDNYAESFATARQALALLPEHESRLRGMSLMHIAMEEQFAGHFNAARQVMAEARSLSTSTHNIYLILAAIVGLGNLCSEQGALRQAEQYYRQALVDAEGQNNTLDDQGFALLGLARLDYERNDITSARQKASQALAYGRQLKNLPLQTESALSLARILLAQREGEQAQQLLQELVAQIHKPRLLRELLLGQAQLALARGDLVAAQRWTPLSMPEGTLIPFAQREQEMLFKARLFLAQEACHKALALLDSWQREEFSRGELEQLALSALAHAQFASSEQAEMTQANGSDHHWSQARQLLLKALELAQPEAFQRLFLNEGEKMASLLRAVLPAINDATLYTYARHLVLAFSGPGTIASSSATSPLLSAQEQRVLHLMAAGHSNQEIARELVVTVNTIKTQIRSIYRKLHVNNRVSASDAARRLGLL